MTASAEVSVNREPSWSKSQVSAFNECRRKHAFNLSGSKQNVEVARLKALKNRYLWVGSLIHQQIGDILKMVRQEALLPSIENILNDCKESMRSQFKSSLNDSSSEHRLFEHEYKKPVSNEIWKNHWSTVETSLQWFFTSKWFERLSSLKAENWKAIDEVLSFDVGGVKSYVKLDCAVEINGEFFLMDWKSAPLRESDKTNFLVGALYAHEVWSADPEKIKPNVVSLTEKKSLSVMVDEDNLMNTYLKIQDESGRLNEDPLDPEADPMNVAMTENQNLCDRCNYNRLCHP